MGAKAWLVRLFSGKLDRKASLSESQKTGPGSLTMEQSRTKQHEAVRKMRRGVADVSVSRQRLDLQASDLQKAMDKLLGQATASTETGDHRAAQTAMARHLIMSGQFSDLLSQRNALADQEIMLLGALNQLQARAAGFSVTVETIAATMTAAQAHQLIAESLKEIGDDVDKLSVASLPEPALLNDPLKLPPRSYGTENNVSTGPKKTD